MSLREQWDALLLRADLAAPPARSTPSSPTTPFGPPAAGPLFHTEPMRSLEPVARANVERELQLLGGR